MTKPLVVTPTIGTRGGVVGRPRAHPPQNAAKSIEDFAAEGRAIMGIAAAMRTSRETLRRWMTDYPELQEAFEIGRERERHELHSLVKRDARDGGKPNINAFFILQRRHGYREGDSGDQPNRINITVNLPGSISRDDYMKKVIADE